MIIATFRVHGHYLGLPVKHVQEILRPQRLTRVPLAQTAVRGLLNLRGSILTAIEVRRRLGFPDREPGHQPMHVVIKLGERAVSLLVDEIGDVVDAPLADSEDFPDNISGPLRDLTWRIFKLEDELLILLDAERLASLEEQKK